LTGASLLGAPDRGGATPPFAIDKRRSAGGSCGHAMRPLSARCCVVPRASDAPGDTCGAASTARPKRRHNGLGSQAASPRNFSAA
jgi:hypothetical protein